MSLKPICVSCQRFYRPSRNGVYFLEGMPGENGVKPGRVEAWRWKNYKLWAGDEWQCPGCASTIIVGVPHQHIAEHYQPDFEEKVRAFGATFRVNDC
jgi:hypothetical protein